MSHAKELIKCVEAVLNSNLTPYRIAKEVGYAGANPVHDLKSGKSDIMKIQLGTALKFEELYNKSLKEMGKMEETTWEFENYTVYKEMDLLRFENDEGKILGYITLTDESIDELNNGVNPIKDRWEDGIGNTINISGWGEEE